MTLRFAAVFETVTIGSRLVTVSGQEQTATELFHMDGKEHPGTLNAGVRSTGKWVNAHVIETGGTKPLRLAGTGARVRPTVTPRTA